VFNGQQRVQRVLKSQQHRGAGHQPWNGDVTVPTRRDAFRISLLHGTVAWYWLPRQA
jgi:hypothetical protein